MVQSTEVFVGIDVSKTRNAVAVADGERGGEVRYLGEVDAGEDSVPRLGVDFDEGAPDAEDRTQARLSARQCALACDLRGEGRKLPYVQIRRPGRFHGAVSPPA